MHSARDALLGALSRFDPPSGRVDTDRPALAELAQQNGLTPLTAYNLDYKMDGAGAPQEIRDHLLALYQGTLNDNVYQLVTLKRLLAEASEVPLLLLDAASVADGLHPHIAFRPISEIRLGVHAGSLASLVAGAAKGGFKAAGAGGQG